MYEGCWHDILKNPKDLPESGKEVLVTCICGDNGKIEYFIFITRYNFSRDIWENCDTEIVTAWAELPQPYKVKL